MRRSGAAITFLLVPALLHIHIHHHFHGPPVDYLGLAAAAAASWIGLPGPGEPVLFAAAVLCARHELDLATVLAVAWLSATAGGVVGWAVGLKAGRAIVTARGPLRGARVRTVQRGERLFERHPVIAILLTPAFVAGIHGVRSRIYQPINAVSAAVWAAAIGIGGYVIGPPILDVFGDIGTAFTVIVIAAVLVALVIELARRRRRHAGNRRA